jgi:hypothetical protein
VRKKRECIIKLRWLIHLQAQQCAVYKNTCSLCCWEKGSKMTWKFN